MSFIMAIADSKNAIFISDGRVTKLEGNKCVIVEENYKKILKVNKRMCIGYSGCTETCKEVISELKKYDYNKLVDLELVFKILYKKSKQVCSMYNKNDTGYKLNLVIGGTTKENEIKLISFGSKKNFAYEVLSPQKGDLKYCYLSSPLSKIDDGKIKQSILNNKSNLAKGLKECVEYVAKSDISVNTNMFLESISIK